MCSPLPSWSASERASGLFGGPFLPPLRRRSTTTLFFFAVNEGRSAGGEEGGRGKLGRGRGSWGANLQHVRGKSQSFKMSTQSCHFFSLGRNALYSLCLDSVDAAQICSFFAWNWKLEGPFGFVLSLHGISRSKFPHFYRSWGH